MRMFFDFLFRASYEGMNHVRVASRRDRSEGHEGKKVSKIFCVSLMDFFITQRRKEECESVVLVS